MIKFEVVLIFNPDLATNALNSEVDNFKSKITSQSAKIINEENRIYKSVISKISKFNKIEKNH